MRRPEVWAVLVAIAVAYTPFVTNQGLLITDDGFTSDVANAEWPARVEIGRLLREGSWPAWTRNIYGGANLLPTGAGAEPLTLLLFSALDPVTALNAYLVCLLAIAGLGTAFFARALSATPAGAAAAGIGFMLSGYMVCQLKHLSIISCIAWAPWALLALFRAFEHPRRRTRWLAGFAVFYGMQWLAGFAQSAYIATLLYIAWGFAQIIRRRSLGQLRADVLAFGAAGVTGALIGAIQLYSTYELTRLSSRSEGVSFQWATQFNYWLPDLKTFVVPYINGDISDHTYIGHGIFWEDYSYAGLVTLLLACATLVAPRVRAVRFLWVSAVLATLMVVGKHTPLFELAFRFVPGMSFFRFSTRFLFVTHLALCLLASLGLTRLQAWLGARFSPATARLAPLVCWLVVGLSFADLQYFQLRQNAIADAKRWTNPTPSGEFLKANLGDFRAFSFLARQAHQRASHAARGWADLEPFYECRELIQPDANLTLGVSMPDGYMGLVTRETGFLWGSSQVPSRVGSLVDAALKSDVALHELTQVLQVLGVKYLISPVPLALPTPIALGSLTAYELAQPANRFYVASRTQGVENDDAAFGVMRGAGFEPGHDVVWVGPSETEAIDGSATILTRGRETALSSELTVDGPNPVWLVNGESFHPRWVATIDGSPAEVRRVNINQRALRVPAGPHVVRLSFDGFAYGVGLAVTLVSLLGALGLAAFSERS